MSGTNVSAKGKLLSFRIPRKEKVFPENFDHLYDTLVRPVRNHLYRLGVIEELDDVTQEVFIRIWKGRQSFQGKSKLRTWAIAIATRTAMDYFRKSKDLPVSDETFRDIPTHQNQDFTNRDLVLKALSKLSYDHRLVLVLAYYEEYSLKEISQITESALGTVKSRLFHARQEVSTIINKEVGNEDSIG